MGKMPEAELEWLLGFLRALNRSPRLEPVLEAVLEYAISVVPGAQSGSLLVLNEEDGVFEYRAAVGWDMGKLSRVRIPKDKILQKVLYRDEPAIVRNLHELNRKHLPKEVAEMLAEFSPLAAVLTFPITYEGKTIAYFNLDSKDPDAFSPADFQRLEEVREVITLALRAAWERERLAKSEAKLRNLLDALPDAVVTIDERGTILSWNKGAERLFGYSQQEVLGRPVTLLMPEEYGRRHERAFAKCLAEGREPHRFVEGEGLRKDGTRFPVHWSLSGYEQRGRRFFVAVGRDLTERVEIFGKAKEGSGCSSSGSPTRSSSRASTARSWKRMRLPAGRPATLATNSSG